MNQDTHTPILRQKTVISFAVISVLCITVGLYYWLGAWAYVFGKPYLTAKDSRALYLSLKANRPLKRELSTHLSTSKSRK